MEATVGDRNTALAVDCIRLVQVTWSESCGLNQIGLYHRACVQVRWCAEQRAVLFDPDVRGREDVPERRDQLPGR